MLSHWGYGEGQMEYGNLRGCPSTVLLLFKNFGPIGVSITSQFWQCLRWRRQRTSMYGFYTDFDDLIQLNSTLCLCVCSVTQSCPTLCNPMDCSQPGFSVHGFPRQEYWTGLPFPPLGDLPNPGIEPASSASPALAGGFFTTEPPGKSHS